jgi:hypothetical protein
MTGNHRLAMVQGADEHPLDRDYWYFTFGLDHPLAGRYVILLGTHEGTRELMTRIFGQGNWAAQYMRERGLELVSRHGLVKLDLGLGGNG